MIAIAARIVRAIPIAHLKVGNAMTTSLGTSSTISIAVAMTIMVMMAAAPTRTAAPMMAIAARIVQAIPIAHRKVGNATTTSLGTSSTISIVLVIMVQRRRMGEIHLTHVLTDCTTQGKITVHVSLSRTIRSC